MSHTPRSTHGMIYTPEGEGYRVVARSKYNYLFASAPDRATAVAFAAVLLRCPTFRHAYEAFRDDFAVRVDYRRLSICSGDTDIRFRSLNYEPWVKRWAVVGTPLVFCYVDADGWGLEAGFPFPAGQRPTPGVHVYTEDVYYLYTDYLMSARVARLPPELCEEAETIYDYLDICAF